MRRIALITVMVVACAGAAHAADDRRDGNYWNRMERGRKGTYITGFFDGMDLGEHYTLPDPRSKAAFDAALKSYDVAVAGYFKNVTSGQLLDGLDEFYKDFKNRSIEIPWALDIVVRQIAGEDVEQLTVLRRRIAGGE